MTIHINTYVKMSKQHLPSFNVHRSVAFCWGLLQGPSTQRMHNAMKCSATTTSATIASHSQQERQLVQAVPVNTTHRIWMKQSTELLSKAFGIYRKRKPRTASSPNHVRGKAHAYTMACLALAAWLRGFELRLPFGFVVFSVEGPLPFLPYAG